MLARLGGEAPHPPTTGRGEPSPADGAVTSIGLSLQCREVNRLDIRSPPGAPLRGGGRTGPRAVNGALGALAQALDLAPREDSISRNVVRLARKPRIRRTVGTDLEHWQPEQIQRFVETADHDRLAGAWRLPCSGLTRAGVLGVRWSAPPRSPASRPGRRPPGEDADDGNMGGDAVLLCATVACPALLAGTSIPGWKATLRVVKSPAGGLSVPTRSGRYDLVRAAAWAVSTLVANEAEPLPFYVF